MKALSKVATALLALSALTLAAQEEDAASGVVESQPPVPIINPAKSRDQLEQAYQKEYAFLEAQLRDLRDRLGAFESQAENAQAQKEASIDRIEAEYIRLQSDGDRLNDLLVEADRQIESVQDSRSTLEATFAQAGSTLEQYAEEFSDLEVLTSQEFRESGDAEKISTLFDETLNLLTGLSSVREIQGEFFLRDGTEVNGTIVKVGNIASYGNSGAGGGALAPAGEGRLKVWPESSAELAGELAAGGKPSTLGIFLYESPTAAIEEREGKTFLGVINSGGIIAWIIVFLGGLGLMMILLRVVFLRRARFRTGKVGTNIADLVSKGSLEEALAACKDLRGAASRVVAAAIRNLEHDRDHIEDIVSEAILHESPHLNRFGAAILVIAAVAPLLGLLGTVTGMITTFDIITEFGTGDPKLLSSGISIALVTTEVGLAVAIPTLIFGNLLSGWAESIKQEMERAALNVTNLYKANVEIKAGAS